MTDHSVLILDAPLFRGIEAEGPFKGERVLFVADPKLRFENIEPHLDGVDAVYLGSSRLTPINFGLAQCLSSSTKYPNIRVCFEIADYVSAWKALAVISVYPNRPHHLVFTELMKLPDGSTVALFKDAEYFTELANFRGHTSSRKVDDGFTVTLYHGGEEYVNVINEDYAKDVRVEPFYP